MSELLQQVAQLSEDERMRLRRLVAEHRGETQQSQQTNATTRQRLVAYFELASGTDEYSIDLEAIRQALLRKLPEPLVPTEYRIVDRLPRLPNEKIDRPGVDHVPFHVVAPATVDQTGAVEPTTEIEKKLVSIWSDLLGGSLVGVNDGFFEIGGDSLLVVQMVSLAHQEGISISPDQVMRCQTIAKLAAELERDEATVDVAGLDVAEQSNVSDAEAESSPDSDVRFISIQPSGDRPPLYFVHTLGERLAHCRALLPHLGEDQPVFGISTLVDGQHLTDGDVEPYAKALLNHQPHGPYHLVGVFCGGRPAMKLACYLRERGEEVKTLAMVQSVTDFSVFHRFTPTQRVIAHLKSWAGTPPSDLGRRLRRVVQRLRNPVANEAASPERRARQRAFRFESLDYDGDLNLFRLREMVPFMDPTLGWGSQVRGKVIAHDLPGNWTTLFDEPAVSMIGRLLRDCTEPQ